MKIDKKLIEELKNYLEEFDLSEIEYQDGNKKLRLQKILVAPNLTAHKPGFTKKKKVEQKLYHQLLGLPIWHRTWSKKVC